MVYSNKNFNITCLYFRKYKKQIIHCHRQRVHQLSGSGETAWLQGTFPIGNIHFHGRYNKQKHRVEVLVHVQPQKKKHNYK